DLRRQPGTLGVGRQQSILQAAVGIFLHNVAEREDVSWIEEVQVWMGVARGLRETVIEAASPAAGHMRQHAVDRTPALLVLIEPVVEQRPQEAAALRSPEADRALNGARLHAKGLARL